MLADSRIVRPQTGSLDRSVHLQATSLYELLDFIARELPIWRNRPEREPKTSETRLTSQLCGHLNSAARLSDGWDFLQFRTEEPDEEAKSRTIDLIAAPCAATVWIDGRCSYDMETLLPIECKRLPTPVGDKRDEREYVYSGKATTGGIQRFKAGHHGARHNIGAMIGYVQENDHMYWYGRIGEWIAELEKALPDWSTKDALIPEFTDEATGLATYISQHARSGNLPEIKLRHLWITM